MSEYLPCPCPKIRFFCEDDVCKTCSTVCLKDGFPFDNDRCRHLCPDFLRTEFPHYIGNRVKQTILNTYNTTVTSQDTPTVPLDNTASYTTDSLDTADSYYKGTTIILALTLAALIGLIVIYFLLKMKLAKRVKAWILTSPSCACCGYNTELPTKEDESLERNSLLEVDTSQSVQACVTHTGQDCPTLTEMALKPHVPCENIGTQTFTSELTLEINDHQTNSAFHKVKVVQNETTQAVKEEDFYNEREQLMELPTVHAKTDKLPEVKVQKDISDTPSLHPQASFLSQPLVSRDRWPTLNRTHGAQEHVMPYETSCSEEKSKFPILEQGSLSDQPQDLSKYPTTDKGTIQSHQVIAIKSGEYVHPAKHNRNNNNVSSPTDNHENKHAPLDNCGCGCTETTPKMPG